jgi:SAM-dependent methyltransferase
VTVSTPPPTPVPAQSGEPGFLAATRAAYDIVAASYAALLADSLAASPHERAALGLYAELLRTAPAAPAATRAAGPADPAGPGARPRVAEIGCGPGRVAAHLAGLGLDVQGIDLSPAMIAEARRRHPRLRFAVGSMTALDLPTASLDGLAAWYSVIHVPPSRHRAVYAGFHRVLRPDGLLLLGFHAGHERRRIEEAYGHTGLALDAYRLRPERVEQDLEAVGFTTVSRTVREAVGAERTEQAYLIARALEP